MTIAVPSLCLHTVPSGVVLLQEIAWQLTDGVNSCTKTPSGPSRGVYLLKKRTGRCMFLHDYRQAACKNKYTTCGSQNDFAFYVCVLFFSLAVSFLSLLQVQRSSPFKLSRCLEIIMRRP